MGEYAQYVFPAVISILMAYVGYIFGYRKQESEIRKLNVETELEEVELSDKVIEFYKKQTAEILKKVAVLQSTIDFMQLEIERLKSNQCLIQDCPVRVKLTAENKK